MRVCTPCIDSLFHLLVASQGFPDTSCSFEVQTHPGIFWMTRKLVGSSLFAWPSTAQSFPVTNWVSMKFTSDFCPYIANKGRQFRVGRKIQLRDAKGGLVIHLDMCLLVNCIPTGCVLTHWVCHAVPMSFFSTILFWYYSCMSKSQKGLHWGWVLHVHENKTQVSLPVMIDHFKEARSHPALPENRALNRCDPGFNCV